MGLKEKYEEFYAKATYDYFTIVVQALKEAATEFKLNYGEEKLSKVQELANSHWQEILTERLKGGDLLEQVNTFAESEEDKELLRNYVKTDPFQQVIDRAVFIWILIYKRKGKKKLIFNTVMGTIETAKIKAKEILGDGATERETEHGQIYIKKEGVGIVYINRLDEVIIDTKITDESKA